MSSVTKRLGIVLVPAFVLLAACAPRDVTVSEKAQVVRSTQGMAVGSAAQGSAPTGSDPDVGDMNLLAKKMASPLARGRSSMARTLLDAFSTSFPHCQVMWDAGWFASKTEEQTAWRQLSRAIEQKNPELILGHAIVQEAGSVSGPKGENVFGVATGALCSG